MSESEVGQQVSWQPLDPKALPSGLGQPEEGKSSCITAHGRGEGLLSKLRGLHLF